MSENNAPMKMKLHHLTVEITRQCNLHCAHCVRGDAQDVTITPEIIDKLLDQIDAVVSLDLTGGEPFLHPEMVEYLFDGIIKRDISILTVGTVTNGTVCDKRCADAFSKMAESATKIKLFDLWLALPDRREGLFYCRGHGERNPHQDAAGGF